jgi:hypothetical protein
VKIIDQYKKDIEKELQVDEFNIKDVSMKSPGRKHFWVCKLIQHKKNLLNLKAERYNLKKELVRLIQKESPVKLTLPVAEKTAYTHEKMIELQHKIDDQELVIEFLEKTEKTYTSLSFDIKNIIEIMKMETL